MIFEYKVKCVVLMELGTDLWLFSWLQRWAVDTPGQPGEQRWWHIWGDLPPATQILQLRTSNPLLTDLTGETLTHHLFSVVLNWAERVAQRRGDQLHHLLAEEEPYRKRNKLDLMHVNFSSSEC